MRNGSPCNASRFEPSGASNCNVKVGSTLTASVANGSHKNPDQKHNKASPSSRVHAPKGFRFSNLVVQCRLLAALRDSAVMSAKVSSFRQLLCPRMCAASSGPFSSILPKSISALAANSCVAPPRVQEPLGAARGFFKN